MAEKTSFYITPVQKSWRIKKAGGIRVLREFPSKEEALAYAQILISKQSAEFRIQNPDGTWHIM